MALGKRTENVLGVVVLGIKLRTSYVSGKYSTNEEQLIVVLSCDTSEPKQAPAWHDDLTVQ